MKIFVSFFSLFYLDVDECKNPGVRCGTNFRCQDLPNSYTCICDGGYRLSGKDCKGKSHNLSFFFPVTISPKDSLPFQWENKLSYYLLT